jgi:hypothetical protein
MVWIKRREAEKWVRMSDFERRKVYENGFRIDAILIIS